MALPITKSAVSTAPLEAVDASLCTIGAAGVPAGETPLHSEKAERCNLLPSASARSGTRLPHCRTVS
jgi:hypothetical protein